MAAVAEDLECVDVMLRSAYSAVIAVMHGPLGLAAESLAEVPGPVQRPPACPSPRSCRSRTAAFGSARATGPRKTQALGSYPPPRS